MIYIVIIKVPKGYEYRQIFKHKISKRITFAKGCIIRKTANRHGGRTMRIERVDENKIKVLLDDNEAKEWNITVKNISENTPEVQKMFWHAIRVAKESIDFSIDGAKLFVETIPSCDSGIGMFITKVCSDAELREAVSRCSYKGKIRRNELRPNTEQPLKLRKCVYRFDDFDSVCDAAKVLKDKYIGMSTLYKLNGEFYLCLIPRGPVSLCETEVVLPEFAQRLSHGQYVHGKLNEYGTKMIEYDAIDVLNEYFG